MMLMMMMAAVMVFLLGRVASVNLVWFGKTWKTCAKQPRLFFCNVASKSAPAADDDPSVDD